MLFQTGRRATHFVGPFAGAEAIDSNPANLTRLGTEPAISIRLREAQTPASRVERILLFVADSDVNAAPPAWLDGFLKGNDALYVCEPRGVEGAQWTRKNPPNHVARSHYLLGRTVDSGRVWDIAATARYLRARHGVQSGVYLAGENTSAVLAV